MSDRAKYTKGPPDPASETVPGDKAPLKLRVTLGDMALEDAFSVALPASHARLTVEELLDRVFPALELGRTEIRGLVDPRANPDAPEMYDALAEMFDAQRSGRCALRLFANHGPEMSPSDLVAQHLRAGGLLDLVIEQRYTPVEYAVRTGYAESEARLLEWLQARALLYFLDAHSLELSEEPESEADRRLLPIANHLRDDGLVALSDETGVYEITDEGAEALANMVAETESHVDRYDVFGDTLYDRESGAVRFETGSGEDLRAPVYEAEGLDPVRVVFLLALYDSTLDTLPYDWRDAIQDQAFFDELLAPTVDHPTVDGALLEEIIESGLAYVEERAEESQRQATQCELLSRAKGQ